MNPQDQGANSAGRGDSRNSLRRRAACAFELYPLDSSRAVDCRPRPKGRARNGQTIREGSSPTGRGAALAVLSESEHSSKPNLTLAVYKRG